MAVTVILEVKAKPGTGDNLVSVFRQILPDTRSYDGCISLELIQNQDDPDVLIAYECWETRVAEGDWGFGYTWPTISGRPEYPLF